MENAQEALVRQRAKLEGLLQADDEAKRLALALESSSSSSGAARAALLSQGAPGDQQRYSEAGHTEVDENDPLMAPPPPAYDDDFDGAAQHHHHHQRGFSTPQRASIDTTSGHVAAGAAMSYATAASGGGGGGRRSRGPSVGSGMSVGVHGDFTPTLAPQSIPEDSAFAPSSLGGGGGRGQQARLRSRSGTATSAGSAGGRRNRRGSAAAWSGRNGVEADDDDDEAVAEEDVDPLAQFQQEESQLWGGGTRSTLPRLGARNTRSQYHHQQSGADDVGSSQHAPMARSEYVGRASSPARNRPPMPAAASHQHPMPGDEVTAAFNAKMMAASTPMLRDHHRESAYDDDDNEQQQYQQQQQQRLHVATGMSASAVTSSGAPSSFGARLLRSPKTLGDGIMSRLTYALNGMMD
ncbi:hypothetical protein GGI21_005807, partial [Coemansia aciculifera]